MSLFLNNIISNLLIAFGVIVGASAFAGLAALINNQPPFKTMIDIGNTTKIWAVAVALGGTFSSFEIFEEGIFKGEIKAILKQILYILIALIGANLGCSFIKLFQKCSDIWLR